MLRTRAASPPDCRPLLAGPDDLTVVFQPVVDLTGSTVAGYQALARFPGTAGPEVWFAAAADAGLGAEVEALAVHTTLARMPDLPPGTFLTLAVRSHLLGTAPVQDALATVPRLDGLVLELIGPTGSPGVRSAVTAVHDRGARLAQALPAGAAAVAPDVLVLDRDAVRALDLAGAVAGRSRARARLLADDVSSPEDLALALRCGAALARGPLLGTPAPRFRPLAAEAASVLRGRAARVRAGTTVAPLLRPVRQVEGPAPRVVPPAVRVGRYGEPVALLLPDARTGQPCSAPVSLRVDRAADPADTLRRALARPAPHRFDPVLCTDAAGGVLGLLRIEDLAAAVAAR